MSRMLLLLLCLMLAAPGYADERILDFMSDITVKVDGSMEVVETIKVRAEGVSIKRGIFRDFPTDYRDKYGNRYRVAFDLLDVQRDGRSEDYHTERQSNGVRVYIGNADIQLMPGEYTYTISYRTNRQLGFFDDHDELYWNVTGNGWDFPIDHAGARVYLPDEIDERDITAEAYTGAKGSKQTDYRSQVRFQGVDFDTTWPLSKYQGLTIVVGWPKGIVQAPSREQQLTWLLNDNRHLIVAAIGILMLVGFYLVVWARIGRDPVSGLVIPLYDPPKGFSPAAARFIYHMKHDTKTFITALVSLSVKGYLTIEQNDSDYTVRRAKKTPAIELAPGEKVLLETLFAGLKRSSVPFKQKYHKRIKSAIDEHEAALKGHYEKVYFFTNSKWIIPGALISLIVFVVMNVLSPESEAMVAIFMMVWLAGWSGGVYILSRSAYQKWRSANGDVGYGSAIGASLFLLPFAAGELFGLIMLYSLLPALNFLIMLTLIAINILFYQLLKAPTLAGRTVLDKLEGLKLYLEVAEKDEMKLKHPPEKTPALFERLYPYAMALNVEDRWADRFSTVLNHMGAEGSEVYSPNWYRGWDFESKGMSGFADNLSGSMGSVISSSSTAPGSVSGSSSSSGGFSGGGSSGGGGGGGGGGGW